MAFTRCQSVSRPSAGRVSRPPHGPTLVVVGASDLLSLDIPVGARVLVVSDLLLRRDVCPGSVSAVTELAKTIDAWAGPGVIVVAGNLFDLLADGTSPDPRQALAAHPRLAVAFQHFQGEGRRVVVLPGARD